ncbi:hypothetical protein D3C72_1578800 [compost metagenome]
MWIINIALDAITTLWAPHTATLAALAANASTRAVQRSPSRDKVLCMANPSNRSPPMLLNAAITGDTPSSTARRSCMN